MECKIIADFDPSADTPQPVPYLSGGDSEIELAPGRQLFVDDYLIERRSCRRRWHRALPFPGNPVLSPATEIELDRGECPVAAPLDRKSVV